MNIIRWLLTPFVWAKKRFDFGFYTYSEIVFPLGLLVFALLGGLTLLVVLAFQSGLIEVLTIIFWIIAGAFSAAAVGFIIVALGAFTIGLFEWFNGEEEEEAP